MAAIVALAPGVARSGAGDAATSARALLSRLALAAAPTLVVAAARLAAFGRPSPLSWAAKAPDPAHGLAYAGAAALLGGSMAVLAPLALARADRWTRSLALAVAVHVAAMALAGGDWMPLARLAVPALPVATMAAARLVAQGGRWPAGLAALAVAVGLQIFGAWRAWPAVAGVVPARDRLVEEMRPVLASRRVIASIDVGWVGLAAEHARLVDLAGVTDPSVAALRFGHTSRELPRRMLADRGVDAVVLLLAPDERRVGEVPWTQLRFARGTERWIASMPGIEEELELAFASATSLRYVVLVRRSG
jgi:hypothetical protein